jgi:hypothetical protein
MIDAAVGFCNAAFTGPRGMGSRLYNSVVVVFWMATMSWLLIDKVWPTLRVGEPPNYTTILNHDEAEPPVCWAIHWADRPTGWAASRVVRRSDGMREMHSRVFISELPIDQLAPGWLRAIIKPALRRPGRLDMDAQSKLDIDPLGRLVGFDSSVRLADIPDAVRMQGIIDGNKLKVTAQSADFTWKSEKYVTPEALVGDALSPQACLPNLHVGQSWTMPIYSPFRPPNSPMEVLEATVDRQEPIVWNGESVNALVVVYRSDAGMSLMGEPRGKLWVRGDGLVLRQEVAMFNSHLEFTRLGAEAARELTRVLEPYQSSPIPRSINKRLMRIVPD